MAEPEERPTAGPDDLAAVFAEVARELMAEGDLPAVLSRMTTLAVQTISGAQHCGVTVLGPVALRTAGANDDIPAVVDRLQSETGQGPCLDAIREHEVFETPDIRAEEARWPDFVARASVETPVRSILSYRLFGGTTMGALNLYSREVDAFTDDDRHVGAVFAAHAAVAMDSAEKVENLHAALETRDVIATAKGMIMARGGVDEGAAFDILRRASQRMDVKLREVARRLVEGEPVEGGGRPGR